MCHSDFYDKTFKYTKPRLFTIYDDLDIGDEKNASYIKFPSWACDFRT